MGASGLGATSPVSWNRIPTGDGPRRSVQRNPAHLVYTRAPSQRSPREGGQGAARHRGLHRQPQACSSAPSNSTTPRAMGGENRRFNDAFSKKGTDPRTGSWPSRADMTRVAIIARGNAREEHAPVRGRCKREEEKKRKKGGGAKQQATTRTARARLSSAEAKEKDKSKHAHSAHTARTCTCTRAFALDSHSHSHLHSH